MKKAIALLLAVLTLMSLCACASAPAEKPEAPAETTAEPAATTAPATEETTPVETEPQQVINEISIGDTIENDYFTMTFDSLEILPEYKYRTSDYSSSSLYVEDGYKLLLVRGHFTNNGTSPISDTAFAKTVTVNGEYTVTDYDVRFCFQRDKYFEIDPYTDMDYCLYINIPEKLADMFENAEFTLGFNNDMSNPETVWNNDGTTTSVTDNVYVLSGGLTSSEG